MVETAIRRPGSHGAMGAATAAALAASLLGTAHAQSWSGAPSRDDKRRFEHVGTFDVRRNGSAAAEIVAVSERGDTLVYTDSPNGLIGFVDIADPAQPEPDGTLAVGGEPTSVAVLGPYALVAVDTSPSFLEPDGELQVIELASRSLVRVLPLGGQPDSIAISPDRRYAAIAIENERDEERDDGLLPQLPAGSLAVLSLRGQPRSWSLRSVALTGLAEYAASDPEPEYVDINERNQAVVSLQENNHLAIVDLRTASVIRHFSAGVVSLENVDATEESIGPQERGDIQLDDALVRRREPDSVAWLDHDTFATANEGDYEDEAGVAGGSRGFTLFRADGTIEYESYGAFEQACARLGHHNESRAENKGSEPEALRAAKFGGRQLLFVGAERANVIGVYDVSAGTPRLLQMLPTGVAPEGIAVAPGRELVAVAAETAVGAVPSLITLYRWTRRAPAHPQLESADDARGVAIPWVAMSGLTGDPRDPETLYAVSDSILGKGYIYSLDVADGGAVLLDRLEVMGASFNLDLEGIAARPGGGFWLASEGRIANGVVERPDALLRVDEAGAVQAEVLLPASLRAAANSSGYEGVAVVSERGRELVYAVIQREWADDPSGRVKIARYDVAADAWSFVHYPLEAVSSPNGGWVGLSELTPLPGGGFAVIERDNQLGEDARIKRVYTVDLAGADFRPHGDPRGLAVVAKTLWLDLLPELAEHSILTPDKLEGFAVSAGRKVYAVTDNDGLDDALGETVFLDLGRARFGR